MQTINNKAKLRQLINSYKQQNQSIGFVPTMGYLHSGHASLIDAARSSCDIVIVSIFVNPLQFGPNEDLAKYPRDIPLDTALCQKHRVDILYLPEPIDILGTDLQPLTYVNVNKLDENLCGAKRPGHFRGVCTILAKLLNLVTPDKIYLGQKDIQQLRIVERMVLDLNFPTEVIACETYRHSDGLAMSSRNAYLSNEERSAAIIVPNTLDFIVQLINSGADNAKQLIKQGTQFIEKANILGARLDYIEIVDNYTLQKIDKITQSTIIAIALFIGKTRLIDNRIIFKEI